MRLIPTLALAVIGAALITAPAFAQAKKMTVEMTAKGEVPPNDSKGTGTATLSYDPATKKLMWKVTTKDLTGDATMAHIHGPAEPGANAGVLVTLSPINEGSATLTDEQASALMSGKTYVNVHTAANKTGEIRGQVKP